MAHPILTQASCAVAGDIAEVQAIANHLAQVMKRIHGREWRVEIEHDAEVAMVLVVPKLDQD